VYYGFDSMIIVTAVIVVVDVGDDYVEVERYPWLKL
jgi:hypothetical protein